MEVKAQRRWVGGIQNYESPTFVFFVIEVFVLVVVILVLIFIVEVFVLFFFLFLFFLFFLFLLFFLVVVEHFVEGLTGAVAGFLAAAGAHAVFQRRAARAARGASA
jgi:hypothetical protein